MKKKLLLAFALLTIVVLVGLVIATPKPEPEPPLPNPNGYDDFLKAAALLYANPPDWQSMNDAEQHAELQKLVSTNQAALGLVRAGLTKECRVVPFELNATNSQHMDDLAKTKAIAQMFAAASRLALIEGHTNEAALFAVDCVRYGNESVRGGVMIDMLVGIAIKAIGSKNLSPAIQGMDLATTRKALSDLAAVEAHAETAEEIIKREKQWARRGRFGSMGIIGRFVALFQNRKLYEKALQKFMRSQLDIRRMQLQLAAHAYELDHGKLPGAMGDLVPEYLKTAPLDPETGKELPLN